MIRRPRSSTLFPTTTLSRSFATSTASTVVSAGNSRGKSWFNPRSEEHTSELQSRLHLVCRLLLEKKKKTFWRLSSFHQQTTAHRLPAALSSSLPHRLKVLLS